MHTIHYTASHYSTLQKYTPAVKHNCTSGRTVRALGQRKESASKRPQSALSAALPTWPLCGVSVKEKPSQARASCPKHGLPAQFWHVQGTATRRGRHSKAEALAHASRNVLHFSRSPRPWQNGRLGSWASAKGCDLASAPTISMPPDWQKNQPGANATPGAENTFNPSTKTPWVSLPAFELQHSHGMWQACRLLGEKGLKHRSASTQLVFNGFRQATTY